MAGSVTTDAHDVLVVDDDREVAATIGEFLAAQGYHVRLAHTAAQAVAELGDAPASVVLLDLRLPDADGPDLLRAVLERPVPPEVIVVTGHATLDSAIAAVEAGAAGYVLKPPDLPQLADAVRRVVERRDLNRENFRLQAELTVRLAEAESLLAISGTIGSTLELPEGLRRVCRELARLTGADTVAAYLLDRGRGALVPTAGYHVPEPHRERLATATIPLKEQGFYLPIWAARQPVYSDDVASDARFSHELFRAIPHQSGLILPLVLEDEVAGAFYLVWWRERRHFAERELALFEHVSRQLALLLRNVRLYELADRDRRRLDALHEIARRLASVHDPEEVLGLIADEAIKLLAAEGAALRLLEDQELVLTARTGSLQSIPLRPRLRVGESLAGRVVATGEPLVLDDLTADPRCDPGHRQLALEHGLRAVAGVPLRIGGRPLGTLTVYRTGGRPFTTDEVAVLTALADHAALALERERLLGQAERGRVLLERLYRVAIAMEASWDPDERLRAFVRAAGEVLGFDRVEVLLVDVEAQCLRVLGAQGAGDWPTTTLPLSPAVGPFYQTIQERRPIAVLSDPDLAAVQSIDPTLRGHPVLRSRRFLLTPLLVGDRVVGVAVADNKPSRRPIPPETVEPFTLLGQQLATALESARLYAETQAREQEATRVVTGLSLLNRASRALTRTLEVDAMLDGALRELAEAFGAAGALVNLVSSKGVPERSIGRWVSEAHGRDVTVRARGGITGLIMETREPLVLREIGERPDIVHPAHFAHGVRSLAAFPIPGPQATVQGALFLYYTRPETFPPSELRLLAAYAEQLGTALENARLYEETLVQQTRLSLIFDSTSDGILLLGRDGRIEAANRRAGDLLGFERRRAVGRGLAELLAGLFRTGAEHQAAVGTLGQCLGEPDRGGRGDWELARPLPRVLEWVAQPTKNAAGLTVGLTLTCRDVTQEREVSRMKSDFVSFVTHQLRTPLAGIRWMLELATQGVDLSEEARSYLGDARAANERLIGLVNDLLNVARLESGALKVVPQPTALGELTESVVEELAPLVREKAHRLVVTGADGLPPVTGDPQLLRQVVLNLVANAIKYTRPGGEIGIAMEARSATVAWRIRDSGVGIPRAAQAHLFEKFYRADNVKALETEGTGLGLYMVRLILTQLGGRIECESEEGRGSTFTVTLPGATP